MDDDKAKENTALSDEIYKTEGYLGMADQVIKNNVAEIVGQLDGELAYSHTVYGEEFYTVKVKVPRLSTSYDGIPLMISNRLLNPEEKAISVIFISDSRNKCAAFSNLPDFLSQ